MQSTTTINNGRNAPTFSALTFSNDLISKFNEMIIAVGQLNKSITELQSKIIKIDKTINFGPVVKDIDKVNTLNRVSLDYALQINKILREINGPDVIYTLSVLGKGKGYGKGYGKGNGKGKNKRSRNLRAKPGRNRTRRK
jgi:hypothetical protein